MDSSAVPELIQDFLKRHAELLAQHDWLWHRALRGIIRRSKTAEGLRLQLVELVDEGKRPNVHLASRAKALCLLLAPNLNWFAGHPIHANLVNARQPLAGWLPDIANINWSKAPFDIRMMAKELILASWELIPRRTDTVSREAYARHLLEYAAANLLAGELEEMVNMYPLDCLRHTYAIFLLNSRIDVVDRSHADLLIQKRISDKPETIKEYFLIVMDALERQQQRYPRPLLAEQIIFLLKHKTAIAKLLNLQNTGNLLFHLSKERNLCLKVVTTFVEAHLEGKNNPFQVTGLADLETLKAMQRIAGSDFHRLAQQIGKAIAEAKQALDNCSANGRQPQPAQHLPALPA